MFATFIRDVDGRRTERYFQNWQRAEQALQEAAHEIEERGGIKKVDTDYYNRAHGYYDRYVYYTMPDGRTFRLCIVESYFEDEQAPYGSSSTASTIYFGTETSDIKKHSHLKQ